MPTWISVTLSGRDIVAARHVELQNLFETLFIKAGGPSNAAMIEAGGTFYFSPGAAAFCSAIIKSRYGQLNQPPLRERALPCWWDTMMRWIGFSRKQAEADSDSRRKSPLRIHQSAHPQISGRFSPSA